MNATDLRREPIEVRKATLASLLRTSRPGVRLNEHLEHPDGAVVFQHACKMGLEGIVSKRLGSRYRSGRSPDWLNSRTPTRPRSGARWMKIGANDGSNRFWMLLKGDSEIETHGIRYSTNIGELGGLVMKKFLLASVAFAAIAGPAMAADMPVAPPPPPVVYYDWTGVYIGFNAGGDLARG